MSDWTTDVTQAVLLVADASTATLTEQGLATWNGEKGTAWAGRTCTVVLNVDARRHTEDLLMLCGRATTIRNAGGVVGVVSLPLLRMRESDVAPPDQIGGCNAYVAHYGIDALKILIAGAAPSDPWERLNFISNKKRTKLEKQATVNALLDDSFFLASIVEGKDVALNQLAALLKNLGVKPASIQAKIEEVFGKPSPKKSKIPPSKYGVVDDRMCEVFQVEDDVYSKPLCNFVAEIVEDSAVDDGGGAKPIYKITGRTDRGEILPTLEVSATSYAKMDWISGWGAAAYHYAGRDVRDNLRVAIQVVSTPEKTTVYAHLGWRKINGKFTYLSGSGPIGGDTGDEQFSVRVPSKRYAIVRGSCDLKEAILHSLATLEVGLTSVTAPTLACAYTAPLCEALGIDFCVILEGESGTMKSGLASVVTCHYGNFDWLHAPTNFDVTKGAAELEGYIYKDSICFRDDLILAGATPTEVSKHLSLVQSILRAAGDGAGRTGLKTDTEAKTGYSLREPRPPRGLTLMTVEDLPPLSASAFGRSLIIELKQGDINLEKLAAHSARPDLLQAAMHGYLEWLAPQMDEGFEKLREKRNSWVKVARDSSAAGHARSPQTLGTMMFGCAKFLQFAHEAGAVTLAEASNLKKRFWHALREASAIQASEISGGKSAAEQFIDNLTTMLAQGTVTLAKRGETLADASKPPAILAIGWYDHAHVYLKELAAWHAVETYCGGKAHWPHSPRQTFKTLAERGVILRGPQSKEKRNTQLIELDGSKVRQRVLVIPLTKLEGFRPGEPLPDPVEAERERAREAAQEAETERYLREALGGVDVDIN